MHSGMGQGLCMWGRCPSRERAFELEERASFQGEDMMVKRKERGKGPLQGEAYVFRGWD